MGPGITLSTSAIPQPDYDVWILLTVVGTIFVVILASVLRIRCRPRESRPVSVKSMKSLTPEPSSTGPYCLLETLLLHPFI